MRNKQLLIFIVVAIWFTGAQLAAAPPPCVDTVDPSGWKGEYFGNIGLHGSPLIVRNDGTGYLDFQWGNGTPDWLSCGLGADQFSVRWTRTLSFDEGRYQFIVRTDDGARLYIDGVRILDKWFGRSATTADIVEYDLRAGAHTIALEYFEGWGDASAMLSWRRLPAPGRQTRVVIIDIDGLSSAVLNDALRPLRDDWLPNIKQILGNRTGDKFDNAIIFDNARTVFPSVTLTAQASLFTGRVPRDHGIVGNMWFMRLHDEVPYPGDSRMVDYTYAGKDRNLLVLPCVHGLDLGVCQGGLANAHLTVPTVYQPAAQAGLRSLVAYNQYWKGAGAVIQPGPLALSSFGWAKADDWNLGTVNPLDTFREYDEGMIKRVIEEQILAGGSVPDIITLYFAGLDATGHYAGRIATLAYLLDVVDAAIGRFIKALKDSGVRMDDVVFIITSDHGRTDIPPERLESFKTLQSRLQEALARGGFKVGEDAQVAVNGGMAHIYVRHGRAGDDWWPSYEEDVLPAARAISADAGLREWLSGVYSRQCFLVSGAYGFIACSPYEAHFEEAGQQSAPSRKQLLEDLNTIRSGDIVVTLKEPDYFLRDDDSEAKWGRGSSHGGWWQSDLSIPLIVAGKTIVGTRNSAEGLGNVNVAKTVAKLLGFDAGLPDAAPALPLSGEACDLRSQFLGQYYANMTLAGQPVLTRCEDTVSYEWDAAAPHPLVPPDRFSVRWTREILVAEGTYRFRITVDDGARLYVDNVSLISAWRDQAPTSYSAEVNLSSGVHTIRMEYYENAGGATAKLSWERLVAPTAALATLTISPSVVTGGASATGSVALNGPAPAGGALVLLQSSAAVAQVPSSVTIPAGQASASFTVSTTPVTATQTVTITATYQGLSRSATLTLQPGLSLPQTLSGTLTSADGRAQGCSGCYADSYQFTLTSPPAPGQDVAILLESRDFDAYLRLLDSTGRELAADDNSGFGTNALIRYFTGPGTYRIEASSRTAGIGGAYTLTLRLSQPFYGNIEVGQTRAGNLTLWSELSSYCKGCFRDVWDFGVGPFQAVTVNLTSGSFTPYLKVWLWEADRQQYRLVAENGNPGGGATARVTLQSGTYRMEVTSARPGIGPYTLAVQDSTPTAANVSGRWQARFAWTFSNCVVPPAFCTNCIIYHAYSVTQSGSTLQGMSLDVQQAQITGSVIGNSVSLTLKESFTEGCTRTFNLSGTVANQRMTGSVSGKDDNCGTCRIDGSFEILISPFNTPFGTATDPFGDAYVDQRVSIPPDLVFASGAVSGNSLVLRARFTPGTFNPQSTWTMFFLDTDQNPSTGHPGSDGGGVNDAGIIGSEYAVYVDPLTGNQLGRYSGCVGCFSPAGALDVAYSNDGIDVTVPLAMLNNDDGRVNFKVVCAARLAGGASTPVLDYLTNVGSAPVRVQ